MRYMAFLRIQLSYRFCIYHFSFNNYILSTHYIPGIVLGAGDGGTDSGRYLLPLSRVPSLGLGMWERKPHRTSAPLPDWASLSTESPLLPPFPFLLLLSPCCTNLFWLPCSCLFASFCPHSLDFFTCQRALFLPLCPSLHGDIFPHQSHHVLQAVMFFLLHSFIRE